MNKNVLRSAGSGIALLASVATIAGLALGLASPGAKASNVPVPPRHLHGLLNDYSPAHVNGVAVKGGPYEMRGIWSLDLQHRSRTATFSAALNMETTDAGAVSQDDPEKTRGAHTHHITMSGPVDYDTSTCPANVPGNPPVQWHFLVSGQSQITGNGNQAPFQVSLGPSNLKVCVGGGADGTLEFSNIALLLDAPANTHFGPQPIHGVVTECAWDGEHESHECTLSW
jgi:hypothetical protein